MGGLVGGDSSSAVAGAISAKNAIENNNLKETESLEFDKQMIACKAAGGYYFAEVKGDDQFLSKVVNKTGASMGFAVGSQIKVPFEKALNSVSK